LNHCRLKFDAKCSVGEIVLYEWVIDTEGVRGDPIMHTTPAEVYIYDFGTCSGEVLHVQLTITDLLGGSDLITQPVTLPTALGIPSKNVDGHPISMLSRLSVQPDDETARGFVVFNDTQRDATESSGEFHHTFMGRDGENNIEAFTATDLRGPAFWRFDFSGAASFVAGSIRITGGQVVRLDGHTVVFRLQGTAGERIGFTFRQSESSVGSRIEE
jgi:hypothetical protein